ncbi:MAG: hypothetical protein MRY64_11310 [Hyphomonadaceae bacterium]|nr:hypothetical protein [Hyphomonadaceae bacterium]
MDRLNLDQTGARRGELFRHSLQMGDDTVTIENIATMAIEDESFLPYRTEKNRQATGLWVGLGLISFLISMICFAIVAGGAGFVSITSLVAWVTLIACLASAWLAVQLAMAMRKVEVFHRLRIGASDGRQVDLVDDNRAVLEKIRDTIRTKIDTADFEIVGTFDLDTDTVKLSTDPPEPEPEEVAETDEVSSEDAPPPDEKPDPYAEEGPEFEPEDEIVLGEEEDRELEEKLATLLKGES